MAENVIQIVQKLPDLPSPPGIAVRLLELYAQDDVDINEMATLIGGDPIIAAKLIDYCNSPLLARSHPTTNIRQAVLTVGLRTVKVLALSFSLTQVRSEDSIGFDYDHFWNQALASASIAKALAATVGIDEEQAFLVALVSSVGQLGLAHAFTTDYPSMVLSSNKSRQQLYEFEVNRWSLNHLHISQHMLLCWNFPIELIEAVAELASVTDSFWEAEEVLPSTREARVLKLALDLSETLFQDDVPIANLEAMQQAALSGLQMNTASLAGAFDRGTAVWAELATLLEYRSPDRRSYTDLEARARKLAAEESVSLQIENEQLQQQNRQLLMHATEDSLTGLKNRRSFFQEARVEWARAKRLNRPFALAMIDVDHFKKINDTFGHATGDVALIAIGQALQQNSREYDEVYRIGGEEFVVVIAECPPAAAVGAVERLRRAVEEVAVKLENSVLRLTASFGLAVHAAGDTGTLDELLAVADRLLYKAKNLGRNQLSTNFHDANNDRGQLQRPQAPTPRPSNAFP